VGADDGLGPPYGGVPVSPDYPFLLSHRHTPGQFRTILCLKQT